MQQLKNQYKPEISKEQLPPVGIAIKRIKTLTFSLDEKLYRTDSVANPIQIDIQPLIGFSTDLNVIDLTFRIMFRYPDTTDLLLDFKMQNVFEISDLKNRIEGQNIMLPEDVWVTMVSLSISHARALLFTLSAGTVIQDIILPITNARELTKHLFPTVNFQS